ncbi:MAG: hypothetical protein ACTS73_06000 [Arsenophonus sp. NEOnobi-MAG3]
MPLIHSINFITNGYLPHRTIQTGINEILKLKCLLMSWDCSGNGICFNSWLVLHYLKRVKSGEEFTIS